jgi:hypothetical protein
MKMKFSTSDKLTRFTFTALLILLLICLSAVSWAEKGAGAPNYPARYMGGEAEIITAPNGARIYDKALEAVSRIVYTEPTVQNLGGGASSAIPELGPVLTARVLVQFSNFLPREGEDASIDRSQTMAEQVAGRWIRSDGGYILEIKEIMKDGTLKAAYFNPRAINVARAEISKRKGNLAIFIELRDMNYPGSFYKLLYDAKSDRLIGTYFQAVHGEIHVIEFARVQ